MPAAIAIAIVAGVGASGVFGYHWLTTSDRFAVKTIELRGAHHTTEQRVRGLLGLTNRSNVFQLDMARLEETLEADPWIARARVQRRLPDHLIIDIEERTPAVVVALGELYLAEADGKVFKRAAIEAGEGAGLPVITGITRSEYLEDEDAARGRIRDALTTIAIYAETASRPALGELHLDARRGTTLRTYDDALAIRIGRGGAISLATRLRRFDAAWAALSEDERRAARVVHVDNTSRPERVTVAFGDTRTN